MRSSGTSSSSITISVTPYASGSHDYSINRRTADSANWCCLSERGTGPRVVSVAASHAARSWSGGTRADTSSRLRTAGRRLRAGDPSRKAGFLVGRRDNEIRPEVDHEVDWRNYAGGGSSGWPSQAQRSGGHVSGGRRHSSRGQPSYRVAQGDHALAPGDADSGFRKARRFSAFAVSARNTVVIQ